MVAHTVQTAQWEFKNQILTVFGTQNMVPQETILTILKENEYNGCIVPIAGSEKCNYHLHKNNRYFYIS